MTHPSSPFLALPPELRLEIYTHLFTTDYAHHLTNDPQTPPLHPLTSTSRLLRRESLPVYLSLTDFNAHLDDGPQTPLASWLRALGREKCLWLRAVRVWDLHMLNATLCGAGETERILRREEEPGGRYHLQRVKVGELGMKWELEEVKRELERAGVGLARFCVVWRNRDGIELWRETSRFAMMSLEDDGEVG